MALLCCAYVLAVNVESLATIFVFAGVAVSTTVGFILPGFLFYSLSSTSISFCNSVAKALAIVLVCCGGILLLSCLYGLRIDKLNIFYGL